ncbi:Uncharacterized protein BP5553_09219 [Venustampulla echinocandica]|uniref:NAD(P)-binding protein n=1 Tax=Venustampulla echinocandica TaxID=2656787 RepID=A0A370TC42_9HELO|nr:Uncharacterized protein BP5553_09219 [Venustampulla echinocandica]RDL31817.1 Uncharacterized protein BP5553_09219 [Venustampulla echinocandica]
MAEITINNEILASVRDKVVVVTGGANGIGAATVISYFHAGAHIFFGDWDEKSGVALEVSLATGSNPNGGSATFLRLDVRDYENQLKLFDTAVAKHGRVDQAVYSAGIAEPADWLSPEKFTLEGIKEVPKPLVDLIEINLIGSLYFTRIALAYFQQNSTHQDAVSKSITLVASAAGFKESSGLVAYSGSKHGMVGMVRSLRILTLPKFNVRINAICPWATDTAMVAGAVHLWHQNSLPLNSAEDIARIIQQVAADPAHNGKVVYCAGGIFVDIDEGINRTEPQWLGEKLAADLNRGQVMLGAGADWSTLGNTEQGI